MIKKEVVLNVDKQASVIAMVKHYLPKQDIICMGSYEILAIYNNMLIGLFEKSGGINEDGYQLLYCPGYDNKQSTI